MIPVTKPHLPDKEKLFHYINGIYEREWLTNNGPLVMELEKRLQEHFKVPYLVLVSSGTLALHLLLKLYGLKGKVITTPFSFVATTSSIVWEGLAPEYVDINERSLNIDAKNVEMQITPEVGAILPVHVFGNPADVEYFDYIAQNYNVKIIYDAAHAFGVQYKGKSLLSYGHASILSLHATKLFHSIEGGCIVVHSEEEYLQLKKMINFGMDSNGIVHHIGINAKMNEFQAAMGLAVLDELEDILSARKRISDSYRDELKELEKEQLLYYPELMEHTKYNYSYFPVIFNRKLDVLKIKLSLEERGIFTRRYFYPSLNTIPYVDGVEMPISTDITNRILCLPIYSKLEAGQIAQISSAIMEEVYRQMKVLI